MNILEIQILSDDLAQTAAFYHQILGFPLLEKNENSVTFLVGSSKMIFLKSTHKKPLYHLAFTIPHNQLQASMEWMAGKAEILDTDEGKIVDFSNWNAKSIYFYDNNGNILEFIARFDLKNESNEIFSVKSILAISEIAIVTDDVPKLAEKLMQEKGISYFEKQVQRENFHALGNDNGLLLLSKTNRVWFPTEIPAEKFYVKARFEMDGSIIEVEENKE